MKPLTIFVYGLQNADAPSAGTAALESLREAMRRPRPRLVALSPSAMSTGSYLDSIFDEAHIVPDPADGGGRTFLDALRRIAPGRGRSVLLPGEAAAAPALASLAAPLEKAGIRLPLPPTPLLSRVDRRALPSTCWATGVPWCGDRIVEGGTAAEAARGLRCPLTVGPAQDGPDLQVRSHAEFETALEQAARDRSLPWSVRESGDRDEWSVGLVADANSEVVMAGAVRVLLRSENRAVWIALTVSTSEQDNLAPPSPHPLPLRGRGKHQRPPDEARLSATPHGLHGGGYPETAEPAGAGIGATLLHHASRLARSIGWRGPLEVEFVRGKADEPPAVSRCIPCLPTWSLLASRAGGPLPLAAVAVALGERCVPGRWRAGLLGAHTTEDIAVAPEVYSSFVDSGTRRIQ